MRAMRVAISRVLDSGDPFTPELLGDGPRDRRQRDHKRIPRTGGPYQAGRQDGRTAGRRTSRWNARSTFRLLRDNALLLGRTRNLTPHLSAIIQFRGGLSVSREDEDDDYDAVFSYLPAKIVIRAGAANAFGLILNRRII